MVPGLEVEWSVEEEEDAIKITCRCDSMVVLKMT